MIGLITAIALHPQRHRFVLRRFGVPYPRGAVMSFLIIWLLVSVVCTGLVLLSFRFAPRWEDEPLDSFLAESRQDSDVYGRRDSPAESPEKAIAQTSNLTGNAKRTDARIQSTPPTPNLVNFGIIRTEEPQS